MNNGIRHVNLDTILKSLYGPFCRNDDFVLFEGSVPLEIPEGSFRRNFYTIFCLESGKITCEINLRQYEIFKHDLVFIKPSQIICLKSISEDAIGKFLFFEESFLSGEPRQLIDKLSFHSSPLRQVVTLNDRDAEKVLDCIGEMRIKLEVDSRPNRRFVAQNMITLLLLEVDDVYKLVNGHIELKLSRRERLNDHFHDLLHIHFLKERAVSFYADILHVSSPYLSGVTKEFTGKTVLSLIQEMVVLESKVLLDNPEMLIKQIAEELSFSDQFFFSKYFKHFTGISPSKYRLQNS